MTAKSSTPANSSGNAAVHPDITEHSGTRELRLEIGAKVKILQHKHLHCSSTGYVQRIDGGYNYVHPDDRSLSATYPENAAYELLPNELKVVATYRHKVFQPGTVVRIKDLDWGQAKPKSHGIVRGVSATRIIVQPVGGRKDAFISVVPENLQVENVFGLSAEEISSQAAVLAVLRCFNGPVSIAILRSLLARQAGVSAVEVHLARLANAGTVTLSESQATYVGVRGESATAAQAELLAALSAFEKAEQRLTTAVQQAVVQG